MHKMYFFGDTVDKFALYLMQTLHHNFLKIMPILVEISCLFNSHFIWGHGAKFPNHVFTLK